MLHALKADEKAPIDATISQLRAEFKLLMFKCMFIYLIVTVFLVAVLLLPTLTGLPLVLVLGGSAGQAYAVWRM